jgi:prevent-host-death family protein
VRRIAATDAKNNFGGLLDEVAMHGRVAITRHGRIVAVVVAPHLLDASAGDETRRSETHMIPPRLARKARLVRPPGGFGEP